MLSTGFTAHHGLIGAIGTCSDETKTALTKALSYLGISYVATQRDHKAASTFVLSLRSDTAATGTQNIEFDGETRLWHPTRQDKGSSNETEPSPLPSNTPTTTSKDRKAHYDASLSLADGIREDWTTLLPSTEHVNFLKSREWHKTSLGAMLDWPESLRLMTMKMLADPRPANLYWGPTRIAIYNEPFSIVAASRHPMMMGSTAEDAMPVTYPSLAPIFDEIERTGIAFSTPEFEMEVEKIAGFVEEAWYDGIFSPIRDTDGEFLGLYNSGYEITRHKMAQRNSEVIHRIMAGPPSPEISSWQHIVQVCSAFERDIPLLALYSIDDQESDKASTCTIRYQGSLGIELGHPALPEHLDIYQGNEGFMPVLRAAKAKESFVALEIPDGRLPDFLAKGISWRGHGDACTHIVASPLFVTGLITGFLVIGLNPRRRYDDAHQQFVEDVIRVSNGLLALGLSVAQAHRREEKLANELTQRQKFLQQIAEVATVGLYSYSSEGLLTWANPTYFDITGVTSEPEGRYNYAGVEYLHDDDKEEGTREFLRCLETESTCTMELRLKKMWRPPGSDEDEPCWIMTTIAPNVKNGKVVDVIGCVTDISHLKWAEKVQMQMAEAARIAKQQQERFIDFTSHEMRNPLGAILQCADDIVTLARGHVQSYRRKGNSHLAEAFQNVLENAKSILFCANHQNRIVDDILTISKIDSSMLTITPVIMSPQKLLLQITQAFANKLAAEDIQYNLEIQSGYTDLRVAAVYGDPSRITQVLVNLITNAIKFTKKASQRKLYLRLNALQRRPSIQQTDSRVQWFPSSRPPTEDYDLHTLDSDEDKLYMMFEVEDTGAGISSDEMQLLFKRFAQASPKTHITYGGSGLGLFISRQLVELQGGLIGISSRPGSGSLFAFFIEVKRAKSEHEAESPMESMTWLEGVKESGREEIRSKYSNPNGGTKRRTSSQLDTLPRLQSSNSWSILFVEDNLVNQKVLGKQLERLGCMVHVANHGIEALDMIKKSTHWKGNQASNTKFDIILMDWEMPIMDGIVCTKQIRELEATGNITKHLLIVGATANARPEQVEIAMSAGMDDLMTKPFTVTALVKRIESLEISAGTTISTR